MLLPSSTPPFFLLCKERKKNVEIHKYFLILGSLLKIQSSVLEKTEKHKRDRQTSRGEEVRQPSEELIQR